ncbi:MAG: serine/threonine-protein kinase, partial [Anaerolineae bacterium]|nr:serine/threonine-protein kinase [Anaerolineae bacterium]
MTTDLVGKTIGGYQLAEKIGSGRLATIYKAYQPIMERWVAVKVLPPQTKEALARFQQETLEITHLRHRNIIISYDFGDQDGQPYIVTEYIEGGTLAEHLSGAPLDWIKAVDLLIPITEGLAYAHREGVMHGDIKPSNILLPKENWPLLTDFGLSKFVGSDGSTAPSVPVESAGYLAPERVKSTDYDQRSDIYSLGVVLFEMVTGRVPFSHKNLNDLLHAHATEPVPPIRQFNPSCPPVLELVIITAMNKAPEQRYANMEAKIGRA